jgi:hypothetical protein
MTRPEDGKENPALIRAMHEALAQTVVPTGGMKGRQTIQGNRYSVTQNTTVTTTQPAIYLYVENLTNDDRGYHVEPFEIYTGGEFDIYTYKNPTVDTGTFTSESFANTTTGSTSSPDANAFVGYDNNATISDKGTVVLVQTIGSGKKVVGRTSGHATIVVESGDSILVEFNNQSGQDQKIAGTIFMHRGASYEPEI